VRGRLETIFSIGTTFIEDFSALNNMGNRLDWAFSGFMQRRELLGLNLKG
jgi:hypothetical protein